MSEGAIVLLMLLVLAAAGAGLAAGYAMLAPQLRAMIDIATRQAMAVSKQQDRITFLEACIDNDGGEATEQELYGE
jgi:hypothetical protein